MPSAPFFLRWVSTRIGTVHARALHQITTVVGLALISEPRPSHPILGPVLPRIRISLLTITRRRKGTRRRHLVEEAGGALDMLPPDAMLLLAVILGSPLISLALPPWAPWWWTLTLRPARIRTAARMTTRPPSGDGSGCEDGIIYCLLVLLRSKCIRGPLTCEGVPFKFINFENTLLGP